MVTEKNIFLSKGNLRCIDLIYQFIIFNVLILRQTEH